VTLVDFAVIAIVGLSVVFAIWRGVVREALSLLSWLIAFFAAKFFAPSVAVWYAPLSNNESVRIGAAWGTVFIVVLILVGIVGLLLSGTLKAIGLGGLDRLLGALFGLTRGLLVVTIVALLAGLTSLPKTEDWQKATTRPIVEPMAVLARSYLPEPLPTYVRFR